MHTPCSHGIVNCPPLSVGYLAQIVAMSSRTVFLVGPRSSLLVTHSAGRTWRTVKPMIGDGGGTSSVVFFGQRGIVVGDDQAHNEFPAIWHTADGGANWHVVHPVISRACRRTRNVVPPLSSKPNPSDNVVPTLLPQRQRRGIVAAGDGAQRQRRDIVAGEGPEQGSGR